MRLSVFVISLFAVLGLQQLRAATDALALQQRLVDIFEQNKNAVVRVKAAYKETAKRSSDSEDHVDVMLRVGTGFFISKEGHVLVSASRAAGADRVWIEYQGRPYTAKALGHDRLTNISVLQVTELPEDFSIIPIDTSVKTPELGSLLVAISCPLDFSPSPALGMVTGYDKRLGNRIFPTGYLRTSIPVDGGQGGLSDVRYQRPVRRYVGCLHFRAERVLLPAT